QYAIAHSGVVSVIFAKTFSDSSYSKECSNSIARLKSFFDFSLQVISKSTDPNCLSVGPHENISPLLRFISPINSFDGPLFFSLQDISMHNNKKNGNKE